ncbi:hypothetical protein GP486_004369 [Trichoglossum hirsutum]|uniref:G domain-containing protein n=1 Tax=Trichoglossum hirsutum TaxID=265104 RepID=A0A9P8LBB3_9PEZI|nr:hypothetical protein GP486_004369 [Trichoglossum hirsutum]
MPWYTPEPEILIGVIGVTGAGKTTFISKATGRSDLVIGHGVEACTQDILPVTVEVGGRKVTLIDTPGFDDTYKSDADILQLIANYLATTYEQGVLLTGLILLQPINGNRVQGSERKRTRLFKKVCGPDAFSRIVIATTMWNQIQSDALGERRAQERIDNAEFWGDMVEKGAKVIRHDDNKNSAHNIIMKLIHYSSPVELQIQTELANNGGHVGMTSAGQQLDEDLSELVQALKKEIQELQAERIYARQEMQELQNRLEKFEGQRSKLWNMTAQILPTLATAGLGVASFLLNSGVATCNIL